MNVSRDGLSLRGLVARAGSFQLATIDLDVAPDKVLVVLGPSGAGKTMLLHAVAGFRTVHEGEIRLGGLRLNSLPPERRRIGFVFQNAALFPHLSVRQNVSFGLQARGEKGSNRVDERLERFGLVQFAGRSPRSLSGGERQRVALARALAADPNLLLLDEPLSALDQPTREELRGELKSVLSGLGIPAVHVTHDRDEAFSLADDLAVIVNGELRQVGDVLGVADNPKDGAVARLVGWTELERAEANQGLDILGRLDLEDREHVGPVEVFYRPEDIRLTPVDEHSSASRRPHARVESVSLTVPLARVRLGPELPMTVLVHRSEIGRLDLRVGRQVELEVPPNSVRIFDARN